MKVGICYRICFTVSQQREREREREGERERGWNMNFYLITFLHAY